MKKVLKFVSTSVLALSLVACAGSGKINWDSARSIKEGMTKQEVATIMGQPMRVVGRPDNTETWVWVHVNGFTMGTQSASLTFKDGKTTSRIPVPDSF